MTNQVVYMFRNKNSSVLPLEFHLALMNSRAMYYYMVKSSGETEWRSHPYLTQTQILDLPFPKFRQNNPKINEIAFSIQREIRPFLIKGRTLPNHIDAKLELLIAKAYRLTKQHYEVIYDTMRNVEQLLPVQSLQKISITDIFDVHI